jgi:uncharacterized protein YcgI (DUF1989 family)
MFVIARDTVRHEPNPRGTASHDLLFGRCSRQGRIMRYGSDTLGCQEILASVIAEFGLGHEAVHDPFNIFAKSGIDDNGKLFWDVPDAVAGDYIELQAQMDCLVAISVCPGRQSSPVPHPVRLEIYG